MDKLLKRGADSLLRSAAASSAIIYINQKLSQDLRSSGCFYIDHIAITSSLQRKTIVTLKNNGTFVNSRSTELKHALEGM